MRTEQLNHFRRKKGFGAGAFSSVAWSTGVHLVISLSVVLDLQLQGKTLDLSSPRL